MAQLKYWDGSAWQNATVGAVGPTGPAGPIIGIPYVSGKYYSSPYFSATGQTLTVNRTYFAPIFIPGSTSVDRIAFKTGTGWSGTGSVRLGIYNDSNGKPGTVFFDAGTVSATAASTLYTITISQTLSGGLYWLAINTQTAPTTNSIVAASTAQDEYSFIPGSYVNTGGSSFSNQLGYYEASITGAFATAGTLTDTAQVPVLLLRKL